jgi:hypothetical protein
MMRTTALLWIVGLSACGANAEPPRSQLESAPPIATTPSAPSPSATAVVAEAAPPAATTSDPAGPPPLEIAYPFTGVATIPDDCKDPSVVLTTAPKKMGWDYDWTWTRQALLANPQFHVVDWPSGGAPGPRPSKPMEIRLDMYAIPEGFALVAVCADGATCNKLAAMYRSTVQTCDPRLHCGALPITGEPHPSRLTAREGNWLPLEDANVIGRCARIGVCLRVENEPFTGNPSVRCQSAPSKFKVECAKKATCAEVVKCLR